MKIIQVILSYAACISPVWAITIFVCITSSSWYKRTVNYEYTIMYYDRFMDPINATIVAAICLLTVLFDVVVLHLDKKNGKKRLAKLSLIGLLTFCVILMIFLAFYAIGKNG